MTKSEPRDGGLLVRQPLDCTLRRVVSHPSALPDRQTLRRGRLDAEERFIRQLLRTASIRQRVSGAGPKRAPAELQFRS